MEDQPPDGYQWGFSYLCGYPQSGVSILGCTRCGAAIFDPVIHDRVCPPEAP